MTALTSDFLAVVRERGFIHQCTDLEALDTLMAKESVSAYIGFDCTADSLHVGGLLQIMMLRWLQKTGHRPIVLMGGGTTRIGDPSFRDEARPLLTDEQIALNMAGIRKVFDRFLTFGDSGTDALMVNNAEWLDQLAYIDFLRDCGRHFSVNRMLTMESVRLRLDREQPLSFLEFNYMILQAYDFAELYKRLGLRLQMGGSDQWGNIVSGVDLGRRVAGAELYGLTSPLITTASGAKMGKTAQGAVWLNAERLSPYDYWQFWRNTEDADVGRFLRLFTELSLDEIARLEALGGSEINEAKKILAHHATALAHGEDAAQAAAETARKVFEEGGAGGDLPTMTVSPAALEAGVALVEMMRVTGLASSGKEVKRLIAEGGVRVNDQPVADAGRVLTPADLVAGAVKVSAGKKRHALVRVEAS
ncbi:tyrosine--tRNA ligase [Pararhodospirillum photometricum]|uniref:Tyrosine--tRNA ligase n=1 Tax=Pararhodospirillum photometricum DSM 122 TaxID=1150469 RepID=H6SJN3_PARPM|nr:tyrosine--tRNA ligase [Pararhodospirillum photometricum]CCG08198.1 Tyrosyl-tRNA synthetase [Pararhodospirillum photometricum DSM 122]